MAKALDLTEQEITTLFQGYAVLVERAYKLFLTSDVADSEEWQQSKIAWMAQVDAVTNALHEVATEDGNDA